MLVVAKTCRKLAQAGDSRTTIAGARFARGRDSQLPRGPAQGSAAHTAGSNRGPSIPRARPSADEKHLARHALGHRLGQGPRNSCPLPTPPAMRSTFSLRARGRDCL